VRSGFGLVAALIVVNLPGVPVAEGGQAGSATRVEYQAACACPSSGDTTGVLWRGRASDVTLADVARMLAPVLWFSPDEPLLTIAETRQLPAQHPCDPEPVTSGGVVYYQVNRVVNRGRGPVAGEDDPAFLAKVESFVLTYFFYYPEDLGGGAHRHDLESADFYVNVEESPGGCTQLRLRRVKGNAHGVSWYANILNVAADTRLPMTLLVEEGKHASCPDRNADGAYTPGYDVNVHVNDAWGVRDVFGSGRLLGSGFSSAMAKHRTGDTRVLPPRNESSAPATCTPARLNSVTPDEEARPRYELRSARGVPACPAASPGADRDAARLAQMHRDNGFGAAVPLQQFGLSIAGELAGKETPFRLVSGIALRFDRSKIGFAIQGPGLDAGEFWIVPRVRLTGGDGYSADVLITPSASRWADWYVAAGYEKLEERINSTTGLPDPDYPAFSGPALELGYKFRMTFKGKARIASLGYHFGGVRLGVRASGYPMLENLRAVIEVGAGVF
jgi:hypothetical protein